MSSKDKPAVFDLISMLNLADPKNLEKIGIQATLAAQIRRFLFRVLG